MNKMYPLKQVLRQDVQPRSSSYDADTSARNTDPPCQPLGHFIPPGQSNPPHNNPSSSEGDSNQNQNNTTVFQGQTHQRSVNTGTGINQPSNTTLAPTGITGTTQTSPRRNTQVGGTQTTSPPSPRKHTSLGGTQTTPPWDTHQDKGIQGQLDCNQVTDDDQQNQDSGKGKGKSKKSKKKPSQDATPHPGTSQGTGTVPRMEFNSRNLGTGRPSIQCTACGEYTHWRKDCLYDNFCTTCNNHNHATHMCKAPRQSPAICIQCGSANHRSGNCPRNPRDNREKPYGTPDTLRNWQNQPSNTKILGGAHGNATSLGTNTHGHSSQPQSHQSDTKILGNSGSNNRPSSDFSRYTQGTQSNGTQRNTMGGRHQPRQQEYNQYNDNSNFRDQQRGNQQHMQFDERYSRRYSPPAYPPTPSLNSTFPEVLSRSLLQIAENQSRTIDVRKESQEAQAEAYREMSKTNKMRDNDTLFHSIEVYDDTNPAKFEKWIDSIDQATHITGRDLREELMKKSDGVIRKTLSMMNSRWSDDAVITKLCQDFSSLSTMNRAREELKNLYQELGEPITVFKYKYGQMHYLSTGIRADRETHLFTITGYIAALEPKLNKMVARKYTDARNKPDTLEAIFQMAEWYSKKMLEAESFDHSNSFRVPSTINEIGEAEINEVAHG